MSALSPLPTRAFKRKNVSHMLGAGGGKDKMRKTMLDNQKTYTQLKIVIQVCGINAFVFDSNFPVPKHQLLVTTKDEQGNALLEGISAFSAGGQWCTMGVALFGCNAI